MWKKGKGLLGQCHEKNFQTETVEGKTRHQGCVGSFYFIFTHVYLTM